MFFSMKSYTGSKSLQLPLAFKSLNILPKKKNEKIANQIIHNTYKIIWNNKYLKHKFQ